MSKSSAQSKAAKQLAQDKKKTPKANATKRVTVDIVTGKEAVSVYFDPSKCVDCDKNDYDWLGNHMYSPAQVVKDDNGLVSVCLSSGEIFKMKEVRKVTDNDDEGVDDILKLRDFSEMSLIHTLRVRYFRDEIYTMVGPILISLNPYKRIKDIYSDAAMVEYHTRKQGDLPPHLFVLAEATYAALMNSKAAVKARDQSIIISGESGAGKTEATKVIMTFLTRITGMDAVASDANPSHAMDSAVHVNVGELEQRVLNTNPILEAFGNARTLRNDNSSRFGKFIKIQFSKAGRIVGATIEKYLLEKTRIIHQTPGERNYHIFYQLLRGASDELLAQTELRRDISSYAYLCSLDAASANIPNVNDQEEFVSTQRCMSSVGVEESVQVNIFKLISGVLHLGNILFLEDDAEEQVGGVTPDTLSQLEAAARLLGFSSADLVTSMTKQNMYVGGNTIVKVQTHSQAMDKRSSFAKCIYNMLFSWLVDKINLTIASADKNPWGFIGLLDIYGFENFDGVNSFEQLLINYANEKMQNHFNKHIFQIEQAEYAAESIDWSYISFSDNLPCLDLIDAKPNGKTGIFQTLDDSTGSGRVDVNANFLATLNQLWSGSSSESARHTNYVAPRFNSDQRFGILHYAGEVFYETAGFAEKNRDSMNNDMKELMSKSTNELLRAMAEETLKQEAAVNASNAVSAVATSATSKTNKKPSVGGKSVNRTNSFVTSKLKEDSISKQFTASLRQLFETLETTEPHFVRCVKPNVYKRADFLNANETLLQLKYAGMLETIRIRQQGYALRLTHKEFFHTYSCLVPTSSNLKGLVDSLSKILSVSHEAWQVGTTKLFLRRDMSEKLDRLLTLRWHTSARKIQHRWRLILRKRAAIKLQALTRALLGKKRYQRLCRHIVKLQTVYRAFRHTKSYRVTKKAISNIQRVMMGRMARVLARKLRNPFNRMTYQELTAALKTAESDLKIAFENKDFESCATLEVTIGDIRAARAKLPLPEVVPTSRKEVELYVLEMRFAIEYTLEVQDYASIPALEDRKRKIESYRVTFPTAEEIQAELSGVKEVLAAAMAKKEFRRCGELQEKVTALEKKLSEVSGGQLSLKSVEDLKTERFTLETKISEALVAKDFDLCGNIQSELDDVVAALTRVDVSPEEAAQRLEEVQYEMKVSRETREFLSMAELQEHLDLLQQIIADAAAAAAAAKVQAEVVVEVVPEVVAVDPHSHKTYEELTAEMDALAAELTVAVSKKEYARCEEIEKTVQQLQEARAKLPVPEPVYTRAQLETMVKDKSAEIDAALAAKKYQLCDQLNAELEVLKAKLDAIPTAASVETKIFALQDRLKELIATKQYGKCGEVEAEIEALTPLYERLLAEEPKISKADRRKSNLLPRPAVKVTGAPVKAAVVKDKASVKAASVKAPSVAPSVLTVSSVNTQKNKTKTAIKPQNDRSVAKLRPKAPITASDSDNIFEVAVKMAASRADAALLLDEDGALAGIITDNDVTRRVVSQFVNPAEGSVKDVMTKGPKCVRNEDSALDALEMMVDNRFRHLPVLDKDGVVVGLLDIAKCLYDAISVLEKVQGDDSKENGGGNGAALASVMGAAMKSAAGGRGNNKAQMQAMQLLMEQMFGGSVPTLRSVVGKEEFVFVQPSTSIREASQVMAKTRKGVLVMDPKKRTQLLGIVTPKDLLCRVIAKGLSPDSTLVSEIMTANPDSVLADLTLIDALREMHDHKYLHLPVRDDDGTVLGVVDVMELVCSTAGGNGGKGWRDFFSGAMNARGDGDNVSDAGSDFSRGSKGKPGTIRSDKPVASKAKEPERSVAKLRPKAPITASDSDNIFEVAVKMAASRADAALLLDEDGALAGIITDNDVTRRVVSQFVNPAEGSVKDVMTKGPKCVRNEDSALDALEMMVDNRFRHLPVLDKDGVVVGLLDIAKCLYDAISVLEKVQGDDSKENGGGNGAALASVMGAAMKSAAGGRGNNKAQMQAMQLLMEQMFGGSVPTLRSVVGKEEFVFVQPSTSIREASQVMAKTRKGVLVMDPKKRTQLLGIVTPKDLLCRVIAKGLSPDSTLVSEIMTANPDSVLADLTLIDALREMHDHKYLHLPVRDDDGTVLGVVDVMELVCSTAGGNGGKGWRDFFSGAMNARGDGDNVSDAGSDFSRGSKGKPGTIRSDKPVASKAKEPERSVAKLRPKAPITASDSENIFEVAVKMAASRADAALLLDEDGALAGIITDNDVTRRVVSQFVNPAEGSVKDVMTKGPKCVRNEDSALDALEMMVDNRFRHLPVLDKDGVVVGLLDIAKCLYDAISVLEKVQGDDSKENGGGNGAALASVMGAAMKSAAGGRGNNKAQMQAMQLLMEQMFGGSVPTLRSVVDKEEFVFVQPSTSIREASQVMAKTRKGVLVMDPKKRTQLLGIVTPKDLLCRVIAKGLSPDSTLVSEIMTANPDSVLADLTLIDALREMHDHKYLHLPVRDDDGTVLGVVDVMELVCSTAGGNGGKGWRDFFSGAMNARGDGDNVSDAGSDFSRGSKGKPGTIRSDKPSVTAKVAPVKDGGRSVAKLRPKVPITMSDECTIHEVAMKMAASRVDAALLLNAEGGIAGIITDNDVTRRVVSQFVNPAEGSVKDVMTKGPKCVRNEDSALDALEMMVDNRFRHLPVLDKDGVVVGLLDIAKCLYDAISVLEKVQGDDSKENGGGNGAALASVMGAAMKSAAGGRGNNKAQMQAMQLLMEQMFGGSVPTLRTIIGKDALPSVRHTINVREASCLMTKHRKGLLVLDDEEELVGIITPKDILMRVLAQNKSPDLTAVSSVMTPNPDCVSPDLTLIDALREMHDHKYLHLPVRDDDGSILGLVDVMELVCSTAGGNGGKGWRDFFSGAMNARGDDQSDTASRHSSVLSLPPKPVPIRAKYLDQRPHHDTSSDVFSISYDAKGALPQDFYSEFDFKITDAQGHLHKVKSSATSLSALKVAIGEKVSIPVEALLLKYRDEETDEVVLSSDASLKDAVEFARSSGQLALKLTATVVPVPAAADKKTEIASTSGAAGSKESNNTMLFVGGGVALVAAIGAALFVFTRSKK